MGLVTLDRWLPNPEMGVAMSHGVSEGQLVLQGKR